MTTIVIPGTDGLVTNKNYMLTNLSTPNGSVYNLTIDADGTVRTYPADASNPRQQWQIVPNGSASGYALFNAASGMFLNAPGGDQDLSALPSCGVDDTGFNIVGGNGAWVIRRQSNTDDNVEARGEANNGVIVDTWSWDNSANQQWLFTPLENGVIIPNTNGLALGSRYIILSVATGDACGVTLENDDSVKLQIANKNDPSQQWQLVSNLPATGIAFLNLARGMKLSASNFAGAALRGVAYQDGAGTVDSGFQIGAAGENCWVRRTDNDNLHLDDIGANGYAGDVVALWGWHGDNEAEFMWKFVKIVEA